MQLVYHSGVNLPNCDELDYIHYLIAAQKVFSDGLKWLLGGPDIPVLLMTAKKLFKEQMPIANNSLVATLPKKTLGYPKGGALAVIGHGERTWSFSSNSPTAGPQRTAFDDLPTLPLNGSTVDFAVQPFKEKWAEKATMLSDNLEDISFGASFDPYELAHMWTTHNDSRDYAVIGGPAVRPRLQVAGGAQERPRISK